MISILFPTRGRPEWLARMVESVRATSQGEVEICVYIDDDDPASLQAAERLAIKRTVGPRIMLSDCWNRCMPVASGDLFMMGNDDVIFRTPGWDRMIEEFFAAAPDKIWFVHGDDGEGHYKNFGAHGIVHRDWVNAVGYFAPPYFSGDFADTWLNDVANILGRCRCLPFVVEHLHPLFGKAQLDQTHRERIARQSRDNSEQRYIELGPKRAVDAAKLKAAIKGAVRWSILILTQPSRARFLQRLLDVLEPQLRQHPEVELRIRMFDAAMTLGQNRQAMVEQAPGRYVNFIDDDDLVAAEYVARILPLLDGVDYVGFRVETWTDSRKLKPTYHSLRYACWSDDAAGFYRDLSHVNPILRHHALRVAFEGGFGEDGRWAASLRALGIVKTEHYLDQVMYFYYHRSNKELVPAFLETGRP